MSQFEEIEPVVTLISPKTDPALPFVELAATGKNEWWRYVLAVPAIAIIGIACLLIAITALSFMGFSDVVENLAELGAGALEGDLMVSAMTFALALISIGFYLLGILVVIPLLHGRAWRTLFHVGRRFNWAGFFVSLLIVVLVAPIELFLEFFKDEPSLSVVFEAERFLVFALVAILFLPFQILAEEVFFRGYLMQGVAAISKSTLLRLIIPACLFAAGHVVNTEVVIGGVWAMALYLLIGLYLGVLVLRGNGLEYAAGFHLGNNLVAALIVSTADSSFGTPTIFRVDEVDWGAGMVGGSVLLFAIHYFVVFKVLPRFHDRRTA